MCFARFAGMLTNAMLDPLPMNRLVMWRVYATLDLARPSRRWHLVSYQSRSTSQETCHGVIASPRWRILGKLIV